MSRLMRNLCVVAAWTAIVVVAQPANAQIANGNLVVLRVGDGTTLATTGNGFSLVESAEWDHFYVRQPMPLAAPLPAPACPLCGQPNACAAARTGSFDTPCWCADVTFTPALLVRVPEAQRGTACICRACAEGSPA